MEHNNCPISIDVLFKKEMEFVDAKIKIVSDRKENSLKCRRHCQLLTSKFQTCHRSNTPIKIVKWEGRESSYVYRKLLFVSPIPICFMENREKGMKQRKQFENVNSSARKINQLCRKVYQLSARFNSLARSEIFSRFCAVSICLLSFMSISLLQTNNRKSEKRRWDCDLSVVNSWERENLIQTKEGAGKSSELIQSILGYKKSNTKFPSWRRKRLNVRTTVYNTEWKFK